VRRVTRRDLEELYSFRTTLEQFAFRRCWDRRTKNAMQDLHRRHDDLVAIVAQGNDPELAIRSELILHSWCYELADHSLLQKTWEQMKPNLQFYFTHHQKAHRRSGPLREAHDIYVRCATGDSLDAMLDHLEQHMRQGLERTMRELPLD